MQPSEAASVGLPEVAERLLAGDPIERAIAADALGRSDAHYAAARRPLILGLLADAMSEDSYPAVRTIAGRSLTALLQREHSAHARLLDAYRATDSPEARRAIVAALFSALGDARVVRLADEQRDALRARAAQVAIEIGE